MANLKDFAEQLVNLSVKDVNELATILKDEYGIEPAAAASVAVAGPVEGGSSSDSGDEKTEFDVILNSAGAAKLQVVKAVKELTGLGLKEAKDIVDAAPKAVKELTGLGLKEAKDIVDSAPKAVKEGVSKEEAEGIQKALEEAGAEVELK